MVSEHMLSIISLYCISALQKTLLRHFFLPSNLSSPKKLRHSSKSQLTDAIEHINCYKFWQCLRPTSNLRSGWNLAPGGRQKQRNFQHFGHHLRELWGLHFNRFLYPSLISTVKLPGFSSNLLQTQRRLASLRYGANLEVDWSSQAIC